MTDTDPRDPAASDAEAGPAQDAVARTAWAAETTPGAAGDAAVQAVAGDAPAQVPTPPPGAIAASTAGAEAPDATETEAAEPGAVGAVAGAAAPAGEAQTQPRVSRGRLIRAGGYLLAAVAGGIIVLAVLAATGRVGDGAAGATAAASLAPSPVATTGSGAAGGAAPVLGDAGAPILVEVWADYQCPYCGVMSHAIEPTIEREHVATGRVRLVYRDFAFLGEESAQAAAAARCAGQQGAYWRYHDLLFASQQGENRGAFSAQNLVQLAGFGGLDTKTFAACMNAGETRAAALAETEAGRKLGVESTPTLNIVGPNGQTLIRGLTGFAAIETAIEQVTNGTVPSPTPEPAASGLTSPSVTPAAGGTTPAPSPSAATASTVP